MTERNRGVDVIVIDRALGERPGCTPKGRDLAAVSLAGGIAVIVGRVRPKSMKQWQGDEETWLQKVPQVAPRGLLW
jgi:hypothetical protein